MNAGTVVKELLIFLLLSVVILLTLAVFFYDYYPTQEAVESVQYVADSDTSATIEEINSSRESGTSSLLKSYAIGQSDLKNYEYARSYDKGNAHPFRELDDEAYSNSLTSGTGTVAGVGGNTTTNTTSASQGTFFEKSGSK